MMAHVVILITTCINYYANYMHKLLLNIIDYIHYALHQILGLFITFYHYPSKYKQTLIQC